MVHRDTAFSLAAPHLVTSALLGRLCNLQVSLSREDQAMYEGWAYTSVNDFQQEVVDFLTYRDNHSVGFDGHGGGCCGIS